MPPVAKNDTAGSPLFVEKPLNPGIISGTPPKHEIRFRTASINRCTTYFCPSYALYRNCFLIIITVVAKCIPFLLM